MARVNSQLRKCKAEIKRFTPENGRLEKEFPTGKHHFLVSMVVLRGGVGC